VTAGDPGSGGAASRGSAATTGGPLFVTTLLKGTVLLLDPAGPLFTQIGSGNLRAFIDGTDTPGPGGLSN
jgi:hypothetical protein